MPGNFFIQLAFYLPRQEEIFFSYEKVFFTAILNILVSSFFKKEWVQLKTNVSKWPLLFV